MTPDGLPLVLASTSAFRKELLSRLGVEFTAVSPDIDEAPVPGESPDALVRRLALAKARAGCKDAADALVIGSDQVAVVGNEILGKPDGVANAEQQLARLSGNSVTFLTGLCVLNACTGHVQTDVVPFNVVFRMLDREQIKRYVAIEQPLDCAGSFKSEGLGITLFERMEGDDPTALVGLPLICLTTMLRNENLVLP
jgi:septum formation protein